VLWNAKPQTDFEVTYRGRSTGGTQKILGSYFTAGHRPKAPDYKGLIGYNPKTQDVEGCEIIVPVQELEIEVTYPVGYASATYINGITQLTGSVNAVQWRLWQAGSVLYQGAEFNWGGTAPTRITHHVSIQPNIFNATIAGLKGINKEGWDFLWFLTEKAPEGALPIQTAKHWYSERVYRRANFAAILGF